MKKIIILLILLVPVLAMAKIGSDFRVGEVSTVTCEWTSNSSGTFTDSFKIRGTITKANFIPDKGATAPTDQYDVTITDEYGNNILEVDGTNLGSDLSGTSNVTYSMTSDPVLCVSVAGELTINVSNAGASKGGKIVIYYNP